MHWAKAIESVLRNSDKISVLLMNQEGVILDINTAVTKIFGLTREDLIGQHLSMMFTGEDRSKNLPEKELDTVLKEGSALDENYVVQKNGEPLWCFGESICIKKDNGVLILKIIFNIHKQKLLENHLISKNEELQQAKHDLIVTNEELVKKNLAMNHINHDLDNFVHTVSHDLRAPLNNLEQLINMLQKQVQFSDESDKTMQMIAKSVQKLKSQITDLATTARAQTDQTLLAEQVALKEMMEEVKFNLKHQIEVSGAVIKEDFSEVPSVAVSRKDIISILQNLISNAIKYGSPERTPYIEVFTKLHGSRYLLLMITDNGLGIKKGDDEKIFSMYGRAHEHVEGTGVGLAIVKRIAENYGGKIEVESTEGEGSTFMVYLKQS